MDLSAGVRGGRVGRRPEDRAADYFRDRSAGVWPAPVPDSVEHRRKKGGALCGVGLGGERRARSADKTFERHDIDGKPLIAEGTKTAEHAEHAEQDFSAASARS